MKQKNETTKEDCSKLKDKNKQNVEEIDKLLKQRKRDRIAIVILIIVIIILLLLYILGLRIGKIGYKEVGENPENQIQIIKVNQGDIEVTKNTNLNIFNNLKFNGEKKIAPKSSGSYKFCIKNESPNDIVYHIKFTDKMNHFVNMKYRLKIDNVYIKGNEKEYITIDELNVDNIKVVKGSINTFTLEWYWADDDYMDTYVGSMKDDQYYTLNLEILSEILGKEE